MGTKDKRIDAYIAKSQPFAQPILKHIRQLVHKAAPEAEETIKWGFPHFDYLGGPFIGVAAFKEHCALNFWKASIMKDPDKILTTTDREAMGHFGRITGIKELPSDKIMIKYFKEAARLNKEGIKVPAKKKTLEKKELEIPAYVTKALAKNKKAQKTFNDFSYSHKKEYVEWFTEAKTEETRNKRLATAIEWLTEGKPRMWKYMKK